MTEGRRRRGIDLAAVLLAVILVGGLAATGVGAWMLLGSGAGDALQMGGAPGLPPLGPAGTGGPTLPTVAATPTPEPFPTTPTPTAAAPSIAPATPSPTPAPTPTPAPLPSALGPTPAPAAFATLDAAVSAALKRFAPSVRYAGRCDTAPVGTVCSGEPAALEAGQVAVVIGQTASDVMLGTIVAAQSGGGWVPVLFDPGIALSGGTHVVGGTGGCIPSRAQPARDGAELACLVDGTRVVVSGKVVARDGYLWQAISTGGWFPSRWLCGAGPTPCESVPSDTWEWAAAAP